MTITDLVYPIPARLKPSREADTGSVLAFNSYVRQDTFLHLIH